MNSSISLSAYNSIRSRSLLNLTLAAELSPTPSRLSRAVTTTGRAVSTEEAALLLAASLA